MAEDTTQPPVGDSAPPEGEAPSTQPTDGAETWEKRMSGLQRAHNEETRVLRDQIAALQAASGQTTQQASQAVTQTSQEATRWKQEAEAAAKALAEERQLRIVETRTAKYPHAAQNLGDPGVLIAMDEGRLAGLNELLAPPQSAPTRTRMDANGAGRTLAPMDVPLGEKTSQQLKDDLAKFGPDFASQLKEEQGRWG